MTMLKRIMRAVKSNSGLNPSFEHYYSKLLIGRVGDSGLPSARAADWWDVIPNDSDIGTYSPPGNPKDMAYLFKKKPAFQY